MKIDNKHVNDPKIRNFEVDIQHGYIETIAVKIISLTLFLADYSADKSELGLRKMLESAPEKLWHPP